LVHPIWANNVSSYCSQNGPAFNAAVDALVAQNNLPPAVPLYESFVNHPEYFAAGDVHPNAAGCAAWNQTFASYAEAPPCAPSCAAGSCGSNSCGGTCACASGSVCTSSQTCCQPNANQCGPDGCGGTHPACAAGRVRS